MCTIFSEDKSNTIHHTSIILFLVLYSSLWPSLFSLIVSFSRIGLLWFNLCLSNIHRLNTILIVIVGDTLRRQLGHESGTPMNVIITFIKELRELPCFFHHMEITQCGISICEQGCSLSSESRLTQLDLRLSTSLQICEKHISVVYVAYSIWLFFGRSLYFLAFLHSDKNTRGNQLKTSSIYFSW